MGLVWDSADARGCNFGEGKGNRAGNFRRIRGHGDLRLTRDGAGHMVCAENEVETENSGL